MAQFNFGSIVATSKSGSALADDLNSWRDALHSSHKGPTAPTYKVAGMFWLDDTTAANHLFKYYDGTDWITVLSIDTANNRASVVFAAERLSYPLAGGTANALTLTPAVALAAYFDLDVATFEATGNNTGQATLGVSGLGLKAIRKMVGGADVALSAGDMLDGNRYILSYDKDANSGAGAWILVNPSTIPAIRGYLSGGGRANHLENDTLDATNDIVVRAGEVASVSATPLLMKQAADLTKKLDVTWAAGHNQGMLDHGSLVDFTYHIHRIMRPDTGAADIIASLSHDETTTVTMTIASPCVVTWSSGHALVPGSTFQFSTTGALPTGVSAGTTYYVIATGLTGTSFRFSATNGGSAINTSGPQSGVHTCQALPLLPANYTEFRRIGSIIRTGGAIRPFRQLGNVFKYDTPVNIRNSTVAVASVLLEMATPAGVVARPILRCALGVAVGNTVTITLGDAAVGSPNIPVAFLNAAGTQITLLDQFITNISGELYFSQVNTVGAASSFVLDCLGFVDTRGQNV